MKCSCTLGVLVLGGSLSIGAAAPATGADDWPQWRGPGGDGVCTELSVPLQWGEGKNIAWKCSLPGHGASTPVIASGSVFVTTQDGDRLLLLRIDQATGKVTWTRQVGTGSVSRRPIVKKIGDERREQKFHQLHNLASPSPVTDGERVVVHFGNGILAAYDFAGQELWRHDLQAELGHYTIWWGHANSPVLYQDLVINACMQDSLADLEGPHSVSYVVAYDKRTGKERWKTIRSTTAKAEECDSYTTPIFHSVKGRVEMIVMGGNQLDAYDPLTGRQLWYLPDIIGGRTITGPTVGADLVYATQGMRGPLLAVRPDGQGKLEADNVVWKQTKGTPDSSTPVVAKGLLFMIGDDGRARCCDARTGKVNWEEKFPGDYKASLLAAAGRIYFLNLTGRCTVVAASPTFQKLAVNTVDDETIASLAAADGKIFIRGRKALYCVGSGTK